MNLTNIEVKETRHKWVHPMGFHSDKILLLAEFVCWKSGWWWPLRRRAVGRWGHGKGFWGSGNILLLDLGTGYMGVSLWENSLSCVLTCDFTICVLPINKKIDPPPKERTSPASQMCDGEVELDSQCRAGTRKLCTKDPDRKQVSCSRPRMEMGTHDKACAMYGCGELKF